MKIGKLLTSPEDKTLEFKRDTSALKQIMKTIVAFVNATGKAAPATIMAAESMTIDGVPAVPNVYKILVNRTWVSPCAYYVDFCSTW